ncbi:undecaprenyldiphospho-muramoylpentapeptide beta-N-acetylglucosaminyltransferase [Oricola cellulosilytica]|uniref:UDP-N-acetylglucosamine--N-acetylmuramyl-(pentapeptide) pyrophosphoryl-undecaprenol N-acetylglucosamine transferase n=1 Tax=Oricola cellulosilytica TaxID=1429082 RepID=A0A4R0PEP0_9HYPH|nr:undecaprenyldiphospho-muramoylpentapeptide beta-N-acetylglucosaminyltransferase [Oricola cellulosilytica]TCD15243.1 undecaprenyldiphospho-muramoylpentapeptide beta-N-acetylglucosaminyltransferase [Oricola cellulosilytica]
MTQTKGTILLSAGGTGGHLFPAEALAHELSSRGWEVPLATDSRAGKYASRFPSSAMHVIASATPSAKNPLTLLAAGFTLLKGMRQSRVLLQKLKPKAVVGFGGYPTVPPLFTAAGTFPTVIHEQNAVMGRANKMLSGRVTAVAGGFLKADGPLAHKIVETGNPVRPDVIAAAGRQFTPPASDGPLRLVVFGGSQGARFFSDAVPEAVSLLADDLRARLHVTQQARPEDEQRVKDRYEGIGVDAEVSSFFGDLPSHIADAHLVISRSGASTVSEVAAIGRPAIFVPYPHALDHDQAANANAMEAAGGAIVKRESDLNPEIIARLIGELIGDPDRLQTMAAAAKQAGKPEATALLADLVEAIASGRTVAAFKAG